MTRKLPLLLVSAAVLIGLGVYWHLSHSHGPQTQATDASGDTAAPAAQNDQPAAAATGTAAPAAPAPTGGPVSSAQASDADSTSLEHLAAVPASAALPESSKWKPGVNYDVISPAQPTTVAPGKVEVLEVFWLGCPHCYALEPYIRQWLKTKPAYVQYVRVPVMWADEMRQAHAHLFFTLESLGRDDLVEKVFGYIHDLETQTGSESVLTTEAQQQAWAAQNGISADAFDKAYNSFYVNTQLQQATEITNDYQVTFVPFIAVDGKFSTDVSRASGGGDDPAKLISLLDFLAAWEHDHKQGAG
ncbi:MAG TPA: thiol:disulfide interchange protein DsbA/DsbL [Steroidobacteraceae bacterium]|nr:thiol:disulfide interchange protein DsbA/DsbL [Steroidobacteraceae bacterium]